MSYNNRAYNQIMKQPEKAKVGRPKTPLEQTQIVRSIRLTHALWDKVDAGGMDWLRNLIKKGKLPPT